MVRALKAMIDTMVFDRIVDEPGALEAVTDAIRHSQLALYTTQVQEAQVAAVRDARRRKRLQVVPREVVPAVVNALYAGGNKHAADTMIAGAAIERCNVLVTEDRRLTERSIEQGLEVWNVDLLLAWVAER